MGNKSVATVTPVSDPPTPTVNPPAVTDAVTPVFPCRVGLFAQPNWWDGTWLQKIPRDLWPLITTYSQGREVPTMKEDFELKLRFGERPGSSFHHAYGVAVDEADRIYVTDYEGHRLQDGQFYKTIGKYGSDNCSFYHPTGLALASEGRLLVIEAGNHRVQILDRDGAWLGSFGTKGHDPGQLNAPYGITIDNRGSILLADTHNHRVQRLALSTTPGGTLRATFLQSFGAEDPNSLYFPMTLAVDPSDNVMVVERLNHRVQVFSPEGKSLRIFGCHGPRAERLHCPWGIVVDRNGKIAVSDSGHKRVLLFSPEGQYLQILSQEPDQGIPYSLTVDKQGRLIVPEGSPNRISVFG